MPSSAMTLRPFFSFYGGKWRAAAHYPAPTNDRLVEPFAGGAGYSLRHAGHMVELYDVDPVVVAVWRYLIATSAGEILRLPLRFDHVDELTVTEEARWLIGFWLNKASTAPRKQPAKWMRSGITPTQYWGENIRGRIASQVEHIRHWRVTQASYADVSTGQASWFVDPPYQGPAGRLYRYSDIDYSHLAMWCRALRGQVVVCEQEGADWLPFAPLATIQTTAGRNGKKVSHEVIWQPTAAAGEAVA